MSSSKYLKFNKDTVLNAIAILLFSVGLVCVGYVFLTRVVEQREVMKLGNLTCVITRTQKTISDEHMAGTLGSSSSVKIFENFYNCNEAKRGDLIYFRFSDQIEPVVRIVRGIPGDKYTLSEDNNNKGYWKISINGNELVAKGTSYFIKSNTVPPLKTYELSRGGVLGSDEYIVLSDTPPGLSDSSNLGLVSKKNLIGKVVLQ